VRAGRIIVTIIGALLAALGFGALVGGGILVVAHATQRDEAGFYQTSAQRIETSTAVLVTRVDLGPADETAWPEHPLGTVRIRARSDNWRFTVGGGLIGILVLVAAVVLAATGTYPPSVFDFVMGMNRWCYRVMAYAGLMRDEYPPFRLDMGGTDPGSVPVTPPLVGASPEAAAAAVR
jgi:hypothetical protein